MKVLWRETFRPIWYGSGIVVHEIKSDDFRSAIKIFVFVFSSLNQLQTTSNDFLAILVLLNFQHRVMEVKLY